VGNKKSVLRQVIVADACLMSDRWIRKEASDAELGEYN
jgi:hypothetical protein